jgi:hypothetical protein
MKQTAVEWLAEHLCNEMNFDYWKAVEKAKAMEKENLCYFYVKGAEAEINNPYVTNIEFYNKTFENTKQ